MQLDILFVHSNASEVIYQELSQKASAIEPPIWAGMLANHCRTRGFSVAILDCEAERLATEEAAKKIVEYKAKIVCFVVYGQQPSASTQNMEGALATARVFKEIDQTSKILFVGGHIAALPEETLREKAIDFICQNEGVYTISKLLKVTNLNDDNLLEKVKGLGYKTKFGFIKLNETEIVVPKNKLHEDLPGIAWDLLPDIKKYRTAGWHSWSNNTENSPFASLYTSLGCPYRCSFCMINIINRTKQGEEISSADSNVFRFWEPSFFIKEFDKLAEMGVKNVKIADELFVLNPRHFLETCKLLIERDYKFNIWCYSRVDTCKPEYLEVMKKAGINWVGLGIENPNGVLRQEVVKGGYKEVKIMDIINNIRNCGINVGANYIFGLPMDTLESMQYTLQFALEANTEMVNMYSAMAYPGSPLFIEARKKGWKLPERPAGYSQHSYFTQNLPSDNLSAQEILKFRDYAHSRYHSSEKYLDMIEKKFGVKAKQNIINTNKIKLKRKILGD